MTIPRLPDSIRASDLQVSERWTGKSCLLGRYRATIRSVSDSPLRQFMSFITAESRVAAATLMRTGIPGYFRGRRGLLRANMHAIKGNQSLRLYAFDTRRLQESCCHVHTQRRATFILPIV